MKTGFRLSHRKREKQRAPNATEIYVVKINRILDLKVTEIAESSKRT